MGPWFGSKFAASRRSPGQKSEARTHTLEMEIDHDSGRMEGRCLKGQLAGRALSSLRRDELLRLLEDLRATDPQGAFLIEVYLARLSQKQQGPRAEPTRTIHPTVFPTALLAVAAFLFLTFFGERLRVYMRSLFWTKGPFRASHKSPGQKSEVRTEALQMELDHDSGHMEGRCLKGQFAGRTLSSLSQAELLQLLKELRDRDSQGALLIEAYLDRRSHGWRGQRSDDAARDEPRQPRGSGGRMTTKEAYDVLDLETGAREREIRDAHRRLMMKLHPDQGGSTYLAARINEAKEVLLARK
jgi:DnaJ domain